MDTEHTWPKPQPIETAPNGKFILVFDDGLWIIGIRHENDDVWREVDDDEMYPTHWLPLPPDPE